MSYAIDPQTTWTAADLVHRFGPLPLSRLRHDPAPGTATEQDVVFIHDRENRLYELVDNTLLEKAVGTYESYLAAVLVRVLGSFAADGDLGIVLGADGMLRLAPGLVRIPDASFISWNRIADRKIPDQPIADLVPDLAVEVISPGNTHEEMQRKLGEYFDAGVRLVWYIYPRTREVHVYTAAEVFQVLLQDETLDAGDVLPGFSVSIAAIFGSPDK